MVVVAVVVMIERRRRRRKKQLENDLTLLLILFVLFFLQTAAEYKELYDVVSLGEYSRFHGYAYDGIWAIALALQNISYYFEEGSPHRSVRRSDLLNTFRYRDDAWEKAFLSALETTSFIGVTGLVQFRDNGRKGSVLIKQFQGEAAVSLLCA